jgi:alpha-tubulin suppressor-like RCC1 family protein
LGLGDVQECQESIPTPQRIHSLAKVKRIACGWNHSLALSEGRVYSWGCGLNGKLGTGISKDQPVPQLVSTLESIRDISVGYEHSAAMDISGSLFVWGSNTFGQLGLGDMCKLSDVPSRVTRLDSVSKLSCGAFHSAVITRDASELYMWGYNEHGEIVRCIVE